MITIHENNSISLGGVATGLSMAQRADGTVIYTPEGFGRAYKEHKMPHARYSAAHDAPASGAAGRKQLEADVRALMCRLAAA